MTDHIDIEQLVKRGMERKEKAIADAARVVIEAAERADKLMKQKQARDTLVEEVRATGVAVASYLMGEEIPFTYDTQGKYRRGVRVWAITKYSRDSTRQEQKTNPSWGLSREAERYITVNHKVIVDFGLCLSDNGEIMKYVHETGNMSLDLKTSVAENPDIISFDPSSESPLDTTYIMSDWQSKFEKLFTL